MRCVAWIVTLAACDFSCATSIYAAAPPITALAFTQDEIAIVVGSQAGLEVRSWPALESIAKLPTELTNIHDIAFSPDGKLLAAVGGIPAEYGTVEIYHWPQLELVRRFHPHDDLIYSIAWRNDSQQFALASADKHASLHDLVSPKSRRLVEGHSRGVLAATFLPNDTLLTAGVDASIRLWDARTGSPKRTFANHTRAINALALRPSDDASAPPMVASCSDDRTVRFWQPAIGRLVRFARLDSAPLAVAWTPDGKTLWAACRDGHVRGIDPDDAAVKHDIPAIDGPAYAIAIARDGGLGVGGQNGQLFRLVVEE